MVSKHAEVSAMNVSFTGKTLILGDRRIPMTYPIDKILTLADRVIVLLDCDDMPYDDPLRGRNVFAFDKNGQMIWRIASSTALSVDDDDRYWPSPYSGIGFSENGRTIHVYELAGVRHDLDPDTGEISNALLVK